MHPQTTYGHLVSTLKKNVPRNPEGYWLAMGLLPKQYNKEKNTLANKNAPAIEAKKTGQRIVIHMGGFKHQVQQG